MRKVIAVIFILFLLVGLTYAGDAKKEDKDVLKDDSTTVDKTKETLKEIEKGIQVRDTSADVAKYDVKTEKDKITISKADTVKDKKIEHTKTKLVMDEKTARSIDVDKDGKFGYLRKVNGQVVDIKVVTLAELTTGIDATFSEVIVNGYSGYKQYTFSDVESGDTLNIEDVSGNYTITAAVDGVVPMYTAGIPTSGLLANVRITNNYTDTSGYAKTPTIYNGTLVSDRFGNTNGAVKFTGSYNKMQFPKITGAKTVVLDINMNSSQNTFWYILDARTGLTNGYLSNSGRGTGIHSIYSVTSPILFTSIPKNTWTMLVINASTTYTDDITIGAKNNAWESIRAIIDNVRIYNHTLSTTEILTAYAGGSGISFQPEPSYNFTGYNVASGVEKVLNTGPTCQQIEVVDTTGGTHDVTVTVYFTEDITVISDSHTATIQTVNISHTSSDTAQAGELIPYDILDEYFGTIDFDTTNPNSTITRNATHFMVDTGYITANTTYYYNVSIPNYIEEMVWSDWNPDNETCNAKVQIGNSTPYTTWNITTYNVTNGSLYKLVYAGNGTEVGNATAANGSASIIIVGLADGAYWLTEIPGTELFLNPPFVITSFVIVGGGFVIASWLNQRRKRGT